MNSRPAAAFSTSLRSRFRSASSEVLGLRFRCVAARTAASSSPESMSWLTVSISRWTSRSLSIVVTRLRISSYAACAPRPAFTGWR
jgi:hypothetical protein